MKLTCLRYTDARRDQRTIFNDLLGKDSEFLNGKDVRGKLIVTNQRLYFKAIAEEDKHYSKEINPSNIREVMPFKTFGFISNGLNIITKEGEELKFKVKKRRSWEELINKMY